MEFVRETAPFDSLGVLWWYCY